MLPAWKVLVTSLLLGGTALAQHPESTDPAPSVVWTTDDIDTTVSYGTAVDWFFTYEVRLPGGEDPEGDAVLEVIRCGGRGRCETSFLPAVEGPSAIRWGIDPGTYHRGRNHYTFTLRLRDDGVVSEDVLDIRFFVH
jgi:hypothetical protein